MYNQSFSSDILFEIFEKENRKGKDIEHRFPNDFSESLKKIGELKSNSNQIKICNNREQKNILIEERKQIKKDRDLLIKNVLEKVESKIPSYKLNLTDSGIRHGNKTVYQLDNNIESFFISKKTQKNISRLYKLTLSTRYSILNKFLNLINDTFPKYVIRTDIKSFYESIPQRKLLQKIEEDNLLSIRTVRFIKQTINSYNKLTNQINIENPIGIPRGVGFSSYLSELFMRRIDNKFREIEELIFYERYVDDMIFIFIPNHLKEKQIKDYEEIIKQTFKDESNNCLKLNNTKTALYDFSINGLLDIKSCEETIENNKIKEIKLQNKSKHINFLGYKINSLEYYKYDINDNKKTKEEKGEKLLISMSENKISRYKEKIKLSFEYFKKKEKHSHKRAFKLLEARIRYLTSNTKLRSNKDKIFVGIYYSNPFLNNYSCLGRLQRSLKYYISRSNLTEKEKDKLLSFSFKEGFIKKSFQTLPIKNKVYKNHNNKKTNNKGIVQFGLTEINRVWKK